MTHNDNILQFYETAQNFLAERENPAPKNAIAFKDLCILEDVVCLGWVLKNTLCALWLTQYESHGFG